jgi:hypothetical protein
MSENDLRRARAAKNQSLFREVNERLVDLNEAFDLVVETAVFVCECARLDCIERLELTLQEYETVRDDPHRFFVAPSEEHYFAEVERLVERHDGYWTVEKIGVAARVSEEMAAT